jgi:TolB protein
MYTSKIVPEDQINERNHIFLMNIDGTNQSDIITYGSERDYHSPAWSPDGSMIGFEANRDGDSEIFIMYSDGSGQTKITSNSAFDGNIDWVH